MRGVKGYSNTNKWVDKFKVGKGNPYRAPMKGAIRSLRVFTVFEMEGKPNQVGKKIQQQRVNKVNRWEGRRRNMAVTWIKLEYHG